MLARWNRDGLAPALELDRFFRDFARPALELRTPRLVPAAEVIEVKDGIDVRLDVPGFDPKGIEVKVENDVLTIRGERKAPEAEGRAYHLAEVRYGTFARSFSLPATVDGSAAEARYENGILEVHLPKRDEAKPRSIEVKIR